VYDLLSEDALII